jgi:RNA polymerase sigma-70 factor, ECF subfamily
VSTAVEPPWPKLPPDVNPLRRLRAVPDRPDLPQDPEQRAAALMQQIARGDQEAFAELYDVLAGLVHGIVLRVVRDPAQSEEVTQEVMVELWRHAPRYDPASGSVRSWAATMAHRRAVDRVRSEQAGRDRQERVGRLQTAGVDSTSEEVEDQLDRERVARALDTLTPLQRRTVELAYYGGHTYREVAVLLDVPEGTVKTRIRDGLIRLRDTLGVVP